jgi:hypothetical protein
MVDLFVVMVFGLPAVLVSLILSVIGVWKDRFWLVLLGAVLFVPFSYYLNGSPGARGFAILLPFFQVVSAAAVRERNKVWAWVLLAPPFLATLWLVSFTLMNAFL